MSERINFSGSITTQQVVDILDAFIRRFEMRRAFDQNYSMHFWDDFSTELFTPTRIFIKAIEYEYDRGASEHRRYIFQRPIVAIDLCPHELEITELIPFRDKTAKIPPIVGFSGLAENEKLAAQDDLENFFGRLADYLRAKIEPPSAPASTNLVTAEPSNKQQGIIELIDYQPDLGISSTQETPTWPGSETAQPKVPNATDEQQGESDITDVSGVFEEYPYPQLLQSIDKDGGKSQAMRISEIGYQGDRSEIARCIARMGAAGLVAHKKHARTIPITPKGKQYLEYLKRRSQL